MGNSLRCCLACVIPCGALDLIRIVHLNGYVEEITCSITAGEVLKANPNHVLSKPSSQGVVRRILILSPETELKRGSIYFLIPESSLPRPEKKRQVRKGGSGGDTVIKKKTSIIKSNESETSSNCDDEYSSLPQSLKTTHKDSKKKKSSCRGRRKGNVEVWRPHLESILED